jgi:hypothetical protein
VCNDGAATEQHPHNVGVTLSQVSREPEEIIPFSMTTAFPGAFDFRGAVPAEQPDPDDVLGLEDVSEDDIEDPKDSSVLESVESSKSSTIETTESSASQEETASVEKDSSPPKEDGLTGTQTF